MKYTNTEYQELRNKIWADLISSGVTSDEDENYTAFDNILGNHLLVEWDKTKQSKIEYIKKVINEWGSFTTAEVQSDCSPAISVIGDHSLLVESFWEDTVTAYEYVYSSCVNEEEIKYEDLDEEVINDICTLVENWEAEQEQTLKRCED